VRIGPVWDEAMAIAKGRGESLNSVITRALQNYVRRHRWLLEDEEQKT
jgi:predicted HicB family RNase H-like nuclease